MGMAVKSGSDLDDEDGGYKPIAEINITPMVDVMLVLLIIFMVAAPLMVAGVPLELPKTSAAKVSQTKKPMVVSMTADGQIFVRDEQVSRDSLVSKLRSIKSAEGDSVVYVRSDKKNAYGDVMEVLGRVGEGGYGRVSLLSQPTPKAAPTGTGN